MTGQLGTNLHLDCKYLEAAKHSGLRSLTPKYIVIHSTETENIKGSAKSVALYFHNASNHGASTQLVLDDVSCWRTLHDNVIPWAAPPFNSRGLHIELCGRAAWSRAEWWEHIVTIRKAAQATAYWAADYDIPLRWLSPAMCKKYASGITSHRNVSLAFKKSTHTDPGAEGGKHFPYDRFMALVKEISHGI